MNRHRFGGVKVCGNNTTEEINLKKCVIGSIDVKIFYPSINIDSAVKKCMEMIVKRKSTLGTV